MHKIEYTNDGITAEIEYEADIVMLAQPDLAAYMLALDELQRVGNLVSFTVTHLTSPATDWTYHFENNTGAEWNQLLRMTDLPQSSGIFDLCNVEGLIEQHQLVRRLTSDFITKYQIKKIEITWE